MRENFNHSLLNVYENDSYSVHFLHFLVQQIKMITRHFNTRFSLLNFNLKIYFKNSFCLPFSKKIKFITFSGRVILFYVLQNSSLPVSFSVLT